MHYSILFPLILLFCLIGTYTLNNNVYDIVVMIVFGIVGYFMKKYEYEVPPLALALVLGPIMENSLRQSLIISSGSFTVFFPRPISAVILSITLMLLFSTLFSVIRKHRTRLAAEIEE